MAEEKNKGTPTPAKRNIMIVNMHCALDIATEAHVDFKPEDIVQLKTDIIKNFIEYANKRIKLTPLDGKDNGKSFTDPDWNRRQVDGDSTLT